MFVKGQKRQPTRRSKGSKNKINSDFLRELTADFDRHGAAVIAQVRTEFSAASDNPP